MLVPTEFLPGFGNIESSFALRKGVILFILRYKEGLYLTDLIDHKQELYDIYAEISHTGTSHDMTVRINDLVNVLSNSASEKISRIKRVFEEAIGPILQNIIIFKEVMERGRRWG